MSSVSTSASTSADPLPRADGPHVVVVGGGFGSTMTAVHLAVQAVNTPMRITLVNAGSPYAQGVAYSAARPEHLLNVAAYKMSAFPEKPNHSSSGFAVSHGRLQKIRQTSCSESS